MIRRAIYLVAGAGLGIAGYRRLARLVSTGKMRRRGTAAGTAAFIRDVRKGMAEYLDGQRDV
jgi:hypothetical protein